MPRPEQVAQVEAALRQRFFPFVPVIQTPNRATWTPANHDSDRLSRSLAAYTLVALANVPDPTAAAAVTDGENDGGIDAILFDRPGSRLFIVQSKYKREGAGPSQAENLKTINGIKVLMNRRFTEFNAQFQQRADEIEEALDTPGVVLEVVAVCLGENISPHVQNDLVALETELNLINTRMRWQWHGLPAVNGWLIAEQAPGNVTADLILENWGFVPAPRRAFYGQIAATTLAQLVETHGKALFERNIRHYLGSIGVNTAIEETVRRRPADFFYLNNGLTAIADVIVQAAGTQARCTFRLTNVSIVNGAQTAGTIAIAALNGAISPDARVLITIIEVGQPPDDIGLRITKARNHQNAVRGVDFAALDPNQERLRQEMAVAGITYHYRPSAEARARRDDAFTLEEAAVALACLSAPVLTSTEIRPLRVQGHRTHNAIDYVVSAKKEVGRLWEQDGAIYASLFPQTQTGMRVCRIVRIYRFIDQILAATERSSNGYHRRMFFRHGRYFIMAFIAHRLPDVIARPAFDLAQPDQLALSQQVNELAELIFAQSQPLQASKGYLSIFRNLTDSQPLADAVVQRLAQQDAQRQAAQAAAAAQAVAPAAAPAPPP